MACGCSKGRAGAAGASASGGGTFRVLVSGRQVYESSSKEAADAVASRFQNAQILPPGTPNPT
jgi:hypothetical protein